MGQKALTFSIEGGFVTNLAREWLFDGKFQKAVDLLDSCTQSDGLTEAEQEQLIGLLQKVEDGLKRQLEGEGPPPAGRE